MEDIFLKLFQKRFIITTFEFFPLHIFRYVSAKNILVCPPLNEKPKSDEAHNTKILWDERSLLKLNAQRENEIIQLENWTPSCTQENQDWFPCQSRFPCKTWRMWGKLKPKIPFPAIPSRQMSLKLPNEMLC